MPSCTMPLPNHPHLDYCECYAKIVLEQLLSKSFEGLVVKDKPDLQFHNGSKGIEVTQAIDQDQQKAESLYIAIEHGSCRDEEGAKRAIRRCDCEYKNGILRGKKGTDSFNLVLDALKRKLETLNRGGYGTFSEYDLFIFSDIYSSIEMRENALDEMINISKEHKLTFDQVMVLVPESFYIFNLKQHEHQAICVSSEMQYQIDCRACKMLKDSKTRN